MLERDYLTKMIAQFIQGIIRSIHRIEDENTELEAAKAIETAIGEAIGIDESFILGLEGESLASLLKATGVDSAMMPFIGNSLLLESFYLANNKEEQSSLLRVAQAQALAKEFGFELPCVHDIESVKEYFEKQAQELGVDEE